MPYGLVAAESVDMRKARTVIKLQKKKIKCDYIWECNADVMRKCVFADWILLISFLQNYESDLFLTISGKCKQHCYTYVSH